MTVLPQVLRADASASHLSPVDPRALSIAARRMLVCFLAKFGLEHKVTNVRCHVHIMRLDVHSVAMRALLGVVDVAEI